MNIRLLKILAILCVVLSIIILAEWAYARHAREQLWANINGVEIKPYQAPALPVLELGEKAEEDYTELVARPLFTKGRRFIEGAPSGDDNSGFGFGGEFDWQVMGIYTKSNKLYTLFTRIDRSSGKNKHQKITQDESIEGWRLTKIESDHVVLEQSGSEKTLMLRKPRSSKDANTANLPPPPATINSQDSENEKP